MAVDVIAKWLCRKRRFVLLILVLIFGFFCGFVSDDDDVEDENDAFDPELEALMLERREMVKRRCRDEEKSDFFAHTLRRRKRRRRRRKKRRFDRVLYFPNQKLTWCPVLKASSRSWRRFLFDVDGGRKSAFAKAIVRATAAVKDVSSVLTDAISRPLTVKDATLTSKSVLITRHPFDRLVSAFRDKLERSHQGGFYHDAFGRDIVNEFRPRAVEKFGASHFAPDNNFGAPLAEKGRRDANYPIFWEFVQYLRRLDHRRFDEHWLPISVFCSVCEIDYRFIFRFEAMSTEVTWLKKLLDPKNAVNFEWGKRHEVDNITEAYMATLSSEDIEALNALFKDDFIMFGYE